MNFVKKTGFFLIIIFMLFSFISCQKKEIERLDKDVSLATVLVRSKLVVGVDIFRPPLSFIGSNGKIVGFDIDALTAVADAMDIDILFRPVKEGEALYLLNSEKIDCIAGGFSISEDKKSLYEATKPYFRNAYMFIVLKETKYNKMQDLEGKPIGGEKDSAGMNVIYSNDDIRKIFTGINSYPTVMHGVLALKEGIIESAVIDVTTMSKIFQDHPDEFRVLKEGLALDFYVYAFQRGSISLKDEIEKKLVELESLGILEEISRKWFGSDVVIIGK